MLIFAMVATDPDESSSRKATSGMWRSMTTRGVMRRAPVTNGPRQHLKQLIEQVLLALGAGQQAEHPLASQGQKRDLGQELDDADQR